MSNSEERISKALTTFFRGGDYVRPVNYNPKDMRFYEFHLEEKWIPFDGCIHGLVLKATLTFNPEARNALYPMFDVLFKIDPYTAPPDKPKSKEWGQSVEDDSLLNQAEVQEKIVAALKNGESGIIAGIAACSDWLNLIEMTNPALKAVLRLAIQPPEDTVQTTHTPPAL